MILVEADLEGARRPLTFILDSGAGATLLDKSVADSLGLKSTGDERIRTVHGTHSAGRAGKTSIRLGGSLRFSPSPLIVDLAAESRTLGRRLDGLLGSDFFNGRTIRIDFKHSRLRVSPDGAPAPGSTRLPLTRRNGAFYVGITADDSPLKCVRLDTGCSRSLCWTPPADSALRRFLRDGKTLKVNVNLGNLALSDVPTDVYRKPLFAGEDGLLGTALLSRFDSVWIDAAGGKVCFESVRD